MTDNKLSISEELFHNRQAFLRYNQFKVSKTLQTLSEIDRQVFIAVPRLLHVNQPGLPGYISDDVPCGIYNYTLDHESQKSLEKLFPDTIIRKNSGTLPVIQTILLMGSVGSIAQTKKSDLDYTLLVNKVSFTKESMELFLQKLRLLEKWTWDTYHLETHFFVNDISDVKRNNFGESDSESTGTAMAKLLKEEMFRTMIIVAGRIPFWWIVPVETDDDYYDNLFQMIRSRQTLLDREEFVDIGNVDDISPGEFFGGSIWALIKSFSSPFKTLMKMGVLEEYMFNDSKSNLLCHEIKKKVFSGEIPHIQIDPYLNMLERVEKFFLENKADNEVDALRTAFYLKVGTKITGDEMEAGGSSNQKKNTLIKMFDSWKWAPFKVENLNSYGDWQMNQKVALGTRINKILMNSYKNISDKNKSLNTGESLITEKDTHLLGRKLFSYYNKANYKVENFFALVDGGTGEKELTFYYNQESAKDKGSWFLIRGKVLATLDQIDPELIIKKASTLEFLVAFTAFNKLQGKGTHILLRGDVLGLKDHDLINFLEQSGRFLSQIKIASISNDDLLADARVRQLFLHVDFGNPFPREILLADIRECKNNQEYSEFINKRLERLKSVTYIYMNTWGELFCKTFAGLNSMARCLTELSPKIDLKRVEQPNFLKVFMPTGRKEMMDLPWLDNYIILSLKTKASAHFSATTPVEQTVGKRLVEQTESI